MKIYQVLSSNSCSSIDFDLNKIKCINIDLSEIGESNKIAYYFENVLSPNECLELIDLTEQETENNDGYIPSPVSISGQNEQIYNHIRSGTRFMIDDEQFTNILWNRIKHLIPYSFYGHTVVGLNERLRFLKYNINDRFEPHEDGNYCREDGSAISLLTIQIYLNEGFHGGETTFLNYNYNVDPSSTSRSRIPIIPKIGRVLVFQQDLLHEGSIVTNGTKYTIRTDVMYTHLANNL